MCIRDREWVLGPDTAQDTTSQAEMQKGILDLYTKDYITEWRTVLKTSHVVPYKNLSEAEYAAALVAAGLPAPVAQAYADFDAGAAQGALFDDGHQLSKLIGRPTTPLATSVANALKA